MDKYEKGKKDANGKRNNNSHRGICDTFDLKHV